MLILTQRFKNIEYSPLIDHIGKIEVNENTPQETIAILMKTKPHTTKINGTYSR